MEHLKVTENDLYTFATKNTQKLYAPSIMSLTDIVSKTDNQSQEDVSNTPETIFVLTNFKKHFGASCILYPNVLKRLRIGVLTWVSFMLKWGKRIRILGGIKFENKE